MNNSRGFTLLEVLVALAILALVAASVLTSAGSGLRNASRLEEKTLAGWIADNRMTELQLMQPAPGIGRNQSATKFAGRNWQIFEEIEGTSAPSLLRVTLWVAPLNEAADATRIQEAAALSLTGFVGVTP